MNTINITLQQHMGASGGINHVRTQLQWIAVMFDGNNNEIAWNEDELAGAGNLIGSLAQYLKAIEPVVEKLESDLHRARSPNDAAFQDALAAQSVPPDLIEDVPPAKRRRAQRAA